MNERELFEKTNSRTIGGAYLFEGGEELTKQQAVERITSLLDPGFADLNLKRLKAPDAELLSDAVRSVPLFDTLCVTVVTDFSDEAVYAALEKQRLLDVMFEAKDAVVLFVRRGNGRDSALSKLFKSKNRYVLFDSLDADRAVRLCMRTCAQRNVTIDRLTALHLVNMVGTDAYRLSNELSKLCDYVGANGTLTDAILSTVVTPSTEYRVFGMLDALLSGNKKAAMRMLSDALNTGKENPLRLASFLEGRLKLMLITRELSDEKRPRAEILKSIGGSPKAAETALKNAQKFSAEQLRSAVAAFAEINARMKMGLLNEEDALILAIYKSF